MEKGSLSDRLDQKIKLQSAIRFRSTLFVHYDCWVLLQAQRHSIIFIHKMLEFSSQLDCCNLHAPSLSIVHRLKKLS